MDADSLLSAETLLDLYGEDIRARAYVTHDPVMGERMMRPDFTVPIVERHMSEGAEPARYTYNGPVWRMQEAGSNERLNLFKLGLSYLIDLILQKMMQKYFLYLIIYYPILFKPQLEM